MSLINCVSLGKLFNTFASLFAFLYYMIACTLERPGEIKWAMHVRLVCLLKCRPTFMSCCILVRSTGSGARLWVQILTQLLISCLILSCVTLLPWALVSHLWNENMKTLLTGSSCRLRGGHTRVQCLHVEGALCMAATDSVLSGVIYTSPPPSHLEEDKTNISSYTFSWYIYFMC